MSNSASVMTQTAAPKVLRFKARLEDDGKGARVVLPLPADVVDEVAKMPKLEGVINGQPFRAVLDADEHGARTLRVNQAMLRGANAGVGDTVELAVLGPEPEPKVPADLRAALASHPGAQPLWDSLTLLGRLDWVRWIDGTESPDTRARRIRRTAEQLAEGKPRPCCVNFYAYMLSRVSQH